MSGPGARLPTAPLPNAPHSAMPGPAAMQPVRTACPYCGVGCGVVARGDWTTGEGTIVADPAHPANRGRL